MTPFSILITGSEEDPERIVGAIEDFIKLELGSNFLNTMNDTLDIVYNDLTFKIPLMIII